MNRIGIDFGTSYCTASWVNPATGRPEAIVFNETGMSKMPSIVYYPRDSEPVVGLAAKNQLDNCGQMNEDNRRQTLPFIIKSIKRLMRQNSFFWKENGEKVTHEQVIADILKKIRKEAEVVCFAGEPIEEVVLTHPVIFEKWKKEMLKKAARLAGFTEISLLEEPIAAALGYLSNGLQRGENVLVYDFGGGTFDVAYVQYDQDHYRIPIEPDGDPFCGGDDVDGLLYDRWEQLTLQKYKHRICADVNDRDIAFLQRCCLQKEKISLSGSVNNGFDEIFFLPDFCRIRLTVTQDDFNRMTAPIIEKTIEKTRKLLEKIEERGYRLDQVIMIGGSSRLPLVAKRLKEILPVEPLRVMQVDTAVALGAVLHTRDVKAELRDMYCIHCGKKINTGHKFCMFCGKGNPYCIC